MSLALFDFDGTVTSIDTTLPFGAYFARKSGARHKVLRLFLVMLLARCGLVSNTRMKATFARLFLRGLTVDEVEKSADEFLANWLGKIGDEEVLAALRAHVAEADRVFLVSANFECLLQPLVRRWSLAGVIGSRAMARSGRYTGGIDGTACFGGEKLRRVSEHFSPEELTSAVAYGNEDDAPLLDAVASCCTIRREKPSFPAGLIRRYRDMLSGDLARAERSASAKRDPFPGPLGIAGKPVV